MKDAATRVYYVYGKCSDPAGWNTYTGRGNNIQTSDSLQDTISAAAKQWHACQSMCKRFTRASATCSTSSVLLQDGCAPLDSLCHEGNCRSGLPKILHYMPPHSTSNPNEGCSHTLTEMDQFSRSAEVQGSPRPVCTPSYPYTKNGVVRIVLDFPVVLSCLSGNPLEQYSYPLVLGYFG